MTLSYIIHNPDPEQTLNGRKSWASFTVSCLTPPHLDLSHFLLLFILWKFRKNVKKTFRGTRPQHSSTNPDVKGRLKVPQLTTTIKSKPSNMQIDEYKREKKVLKKMRQVNIFRLDSIIQHVPLVRIRSLHNDWLNLLNRIDRYGAGGAEGFLRRSRNTGRLRKSLPVYKLNQNPVPPLVQKEI